MNEFGPNFTENVLKQGQEKPKNEAPELEGFTDINDPESFGPDEEVELSAKRERWDNESRENKIFRKVLNSLDNISPKQVDDIFERVRDEVMTKELAQVFADPSTSDEMLEELMKPLVKKNLHDEWFEEDPAMRIPAGFKLAPVEVMKDAPEQTRKFEREETKRWEPMQDDGPKKAA